MEGFRTLGIAVGENRDDSTAPSLVLTLMNGSCSTITMTCSITPHG